MGTTAQKLQRVLDTKEGLKDTINTYLGQDITSAIPFKDYETYIKNFYGELPKTDYAEGSNITLSNCLKGKLDYEDDKVGYGDTKQESTKGYQLAKPITFNKDEGVITWTMKDNIITASGTATATTNVQSIAATQITSDMLTTLSAGTYIVSGGTSNVRLQVIKYDNGTVSQLALDSGNNATFTLTETTNVVCRGNIANGTALTGTVTIKVMLESGTTAHEWEPYTNGASPNPSYPQPIQVVTGEQEVVVRGKNWFNNSITPSIQNGPDVPIATGKRVSYTETGGGTRFNAYAIMDLTNFIGSTIRFKSKFIPSNENLGNYYIGLCDSEGNNRTVLSNASGVNEKEVSFVVPQLEGTKKYLCLALYMNSGGTLAQNDYIDYTNMILTIDEEDMTYEPYITPVTKTLSLGDIELAKIGAYRDYLWKNLTNGKWYKHSEVKKLTMNGSEDWTVSRSGQSTWYYTFQTYVGGITTEVSNLKCNYYQYANILSSTTDEGIWYGSNYIRVRYGTEDTANNYKTWLSTHNVLLYYPLATATDTQITDTTLINQLEDIYNMQSVNGTTIIEINGNLPMIIKCRALKGE